MNRKRLIRDNYGISPLRILVVLFVLIAIVSLLWYIMATREISCDPSDQVELTGSFKGYFPSQNYSGFTIVVLGNDTYFFQRGIDPTYLNNLIGHNVAFQCCKREGNSPYRPELYYDLISAVIAME